MYYGSEIELNASYEQRSNFDAYWEENKNEVVVKSGMEPVRMISETEALKIANSWKSSENSDDTHVGFQSGLMTGAGWDTMCEFIGWEICNFPEKICGNYWDVLGEENYNGFHSYEPASNWVKTNVKQKPASLGTSGTNDTSKNKSFWVFPTGTFKNSKGQSTEVRHLFDLAGNVGEFTTEIPSHSIDYRIWRAGTAIDRGKICSVYERIGGFHSTGMTASVGFRIILYVE